MSDFKLIVKHKSSYGKIQAIGVHMMVQDEHDVWSAFQTAERDLFPAVYLYVNDLTLKAFMVELHRRQNEGTAA